MRAALFTNSSTAAAKIAPNPLATAQNAGQAASSQEFTTEKVQENTVLSKNRAPEKPKKADGLFEPSEPDPEREGAVPESLEEKRSSNARSLLTVA
ncbi:MAG: hypothetical protein KDD70_14520 [Bdellovibrionales bacterium]|nr:hypothetical protein [Bdellovibrionales bacterium]